MHPDIQKLVDSGKLTLNQGAALDRLPPGSFVIHKSWGFGAISGVDFLVNQMTIDFQSKRGHAMQLQYAADSLQVIAADHILAQKAADVEGVRARAKDDPISLVRRILESYNGRATQDQIQTVLVPDVFKEAEFKRWWENTKKLIKKDGHFSVPAKKTEYIELRTEAVSRADELLVAYTSARQIKDQNNALDQIIKNAELFTDPASQFQPIIHSAENAARRNANLNTAGALQLILACDELAEKAPGAVRSSEGPTVAGVLRDQEKVLPTLLEQVPAAKLKRVIGTLPEAFGDAWVPVALTLVTRGSTRVVGEAARTLQEHGKTVELRGALDRAIRDHSISSAALTWLCDKKERKGEFRELIHPRVLGALIGALERDQFNESRDRKLHDLLLNDKELVPDLVADAEREELREAMRRLLLTPVFEELNKRSLLARIVRIYPEMESMITGGGVEEKQEALIVSWESLERRKVEYEELVTKRIPQNTQEIAIARDHGDLRENFEFKAAKEMQSVLMRRKAETERDLGHARGTDFANPDTTQVSIGTTVTLREPSSGKIDIYHILGAWDSDPEKNVVSYKAAIAQAMLGHKVGEQLEIPTENGDRVAVIEKIESWRK